ncbi:MAG: MutS family DNA mismatch repair protein [Candidatus Promineifilaceae bacterium]
MKGNRLRVLLGQVARLEGRLGRLRRLSNRYGWLRLGAFLGGALAAGILYEQFGAVWGGGMLGLTLLVFALLVRQHRRIDDHITQYTLWQQIKRAHIARANLDWAQIPPAFLRQPDFQHPFEADLDLVGDVSLHRLVDTCASQGGSQRLREWLAAPTPDREVMARRQGQVRELARQTLFRDRLALQAQLAARRPVLSLRRGDEAPAAGEGKWRADELLSWLERQPPSPMLRRWLRLGGGLALLNVVLFLLDVLGAAPPWWQLTLLVYFGVVMLSSRLTGAAFRDASLLHDALQQLIGVFRHLEQFSYRATPRLQMAAAPFREAGQRPSRFLQQIRRLVTATGMGKNPALWLALNALFPWDLYFTYRLQQQEQALRRQLPVWLDAWFEIEALSALANFAYLNPDYTFPTVLADEDEAATVFTAVGLGHPLLPAAAGGAAPARVCNDFTLSRLGDVIIITGSNMAGKSTFLRTVGINLALAYAGSPVNAAALHTRLCRLYSCIRVSDSVTDGISTFYAEVQRLKGLLVELHRPHPFPLLALIDEIFRGTNNRERLLGSRAYIRALAGQRGVFLISTHDLELVHLAQEMPAVHNYHFRDDIDDGRMVFDYRLYPGPCPTTNALKIMRLAGLPTPPLPEADL